MKSAAFSPEWLQSRLTALLPGYPDVALCVARMALRDRFTSASILCCAHRQFGARVQLHQLFSLLNVPHVHQVHMFYRATLLDLDYEAGIESLEVKLFTEAEIPWDEISFPTVAHTLKFFFGDLRNVKSGTGAYGLHTKDILKPMRQPG